MALGLVRSQQKAGALAQAECGFRKILEAAPQYRDALVLMGQIEASRHVAVRMDFAEAFEFHRRGDLAKAEQIYRALLTSDPRHFYAIHLLGVIFLQRDQFAAAEQQVSRAILINPDFADAHNNLGAALNSLGRFGEALTSFNRASLLRPDYPEAANNRGNALKGLGRPDEALASYDKAIALKAKLSRCDEKSGQSVS